ncbi:unnamed protein product [Rotaria sp. Silwood2]|nr:unnamed protein product [Rotaria sp. Silwood2]CAF3385224.1 unnamed protein product [Rotaria sp. Silwood2]CAF4436279.1 unnamed protein product [Rotaria sp. Silwood2]CAF4462475.1 unnamed protein product [Rotaria sp. Silwood2]
MAYSSRMRDVNDQNEAQQQYPTISRLVKPSNDSNTAGRPTTESPYTSRRPNDNRYSSESIGTKDSAYESTRRSDADQYSIKQIVSTGNRQEINRPTSNYESSKQIPTAHVTVDPIRRPSHGNARSCVMDINIIVSFGGDRTAQGSYVTKTYTTKPPAIRSTATIDDVHYVDLRFQTPQNTAQLQTDGILRSSPSQNSTGFSRENAY